MGGSLDPHMGHVNPFVGTLFQGAAPGWKLDYVIRLRPGEAMTCGVAEADGGSGK